MLRDELLGAKARAGDPPPGDLVFPTAFGSARTRTNVRTRVLAPAIERANARLVEAGLSPLPTGITNHTLRRTYCALAFEAGASPAYAMAQMGHTSPALALSVYAKVMQRKRDTGVRMDALLRGADWAQMGTNDELSPNDAAPEAAVSDAEVAA
jgi:integrase